MSAEDRVEYPDDFGTAFSARAVAIVDDYGVMVTGNPDWLVMRGDRPSGRTDASVSGQSELGA